MRYQTDQLRDIPLPVVLRAHGARQDPCDSAKWHTVRGTISVNGTKFFNWKCGIGGGGAIDLVIHLNDTDFKGAIVRLARIHPALHRSAPPQRPRNPSLQLPAPCSHTLPVVKGYLTLKRRICLPLIQRLAQTGTLYADKHANAVFLLLGNKGIPVGAELRGTGPRPWHGMAPGSARDMGYFSIAATNPKGIILCESAIDALSCFMIHPEYRCISTAGARSAPPWLQPLLLQPNPVYCGFDADPTGQASANAMIAKNPAVKRILPARHDWNDMLQSQP